MAAREEFLDGKLIVIGEENLQISKELFVNFCTPNIFSGGDILKELHEIAGPSLEAECRRFSGLGSGCCRVTDAFEAKQFKKIAHCILPAPKPVERQDEIDYFDFAMAYRNALDMAIESDCKSISFTHPTFYSHKLISSIAVATIKRWLNIANHANEIEEVLIMCNSPELVQLYAETINSTRNPDDLMDEVFWDTLEHTSMTDCGGPVNVKLFENLMQSPEFDASLDNTFSQNNGNQCPSTNQYCLEKYGFDENYIRQHSDKLYDELFKTPDGLQLQLSRNLSATILTIEEENGFLRQYRMTTHNREGDTCYFRCSRCESLMKQTNSEYRPKITVKAGFIFGDCYPEHHPQCEPLTKEVVILQQMDREARLSMMKPMPGVDYPEYYDYVGVAKQEYGGTGYYSENVAPDYYSSYKQDAYGYYGRPKIRGFIDSAGYFYENPVPQKPAQSNVNNTLQAIRKCETELDEDYFGVPGESMRIREEEFNNTMVGDLQQEELEYQINNENEFRKNSGVNHGDSKDGEISDQQVVEETGNYSSRKLLAEKELMDPMEESSAMMEEDLHFPRITNLGSSRLNYRLPSYPLEPEEYPAEMSDHAEYTEAQLGSKCRKYRIIRERRRTNVAFAWRDDNDVKPDIRGKGLVGSHRGDVTKSSMEDDIGMESDGHRYMFEDELDELLESNPRHSMRN